MKILIIGPSWVGDMVMSQSLYIELKRIYPNCIIDVLAPRWCKPILNRMPQVDAILEMPIGHGEFNLLGRRKIGQNLSNNGYTHAIILPNSAKSALIPWFANIKNRIGWKGEFRYGLLTDIRKDKNVFQYMVERYVALAHSNRNMKSDVIFDKCATPNLAVDAKEQIKSCKRLSLSLDKPIVGLCPGAEFGPAKRWPEKNYSAVAEYLIASGYYVWLFGSAKDQEVTKKIKEYLPSNITKDCFDLAGQTSLIEVVDLLAMCDTVVSNDSGLMHVSAAVGCNIVAIYGSTSPKYTPPLTKKLKIVKTDFQCQPCFKRECPLEHLNCLKKLAPQEVINALDFFMGNNT